MSLLAEDKGFGMSIFDEKRLTQAIIQLDVQGLRAGYYSDKYFANIQQVLSSLSKINYRYQGTNPRQIPGAAGLKVGDIEVEAQIFNRRSPIALIAGVDVALTMLQQATGYTEAGKFISTCQQLEVDAVQDGVITYYDGDPENVLTVLEIRGVYKDFALLETPILGVLSRASRVATNVYETLQVSNGKPILFFPARFDVPEVQAIDGYAYYLAVRRYNMEYGKDVPIIVSTDAQAKWWQGQGSGTIPHALIACFLADEVETMLNFAEYVDLGTPRILLADFNNDTIGASVATLSAFWERYYQAYQNDDQEGMKRWTLNGVRLDTSGRLRDESLSPDDPKGVNPVLVRAVRQALNRAWEGWALKPEAEDLAKDFCRNTQIMVSGGFNRDKIELFERGRVPVDAYGVGSTFFANDANSNTDFTMDIVRVKVNGQWYDMPKVGRRPCDNVDLESVKLSLTEGVSSE